MIGALWTGISGLASHQKALDNEASNIANVNTVGFKSSRISFADQMYQDKIGKGSKILDAEKLYTQGNLKVTGVSYDMALSGSGFFSVANTKASGTAETYYTRAGNFRMGDNGRLQDPAGNDVQGWAMSTIDPASDIISTNSNVSKFTDNYVKLAASKVINKTTSVETITAKTTDYTKTALEDNKTVFTGAGYKTQSTKIADIEALVSSYSSKLTDYRNNPDAISTPSVAQKNYIDFDTDNTGVIDDSDQIYVYINGNKISQSFDTSESVTIQKLADQISNIAGFTAYVANSSNTLDTSAVANGRIVIESLVPGESFTIGDVAIIHDGTTTSKSKGTVTEVAEGTGYGAVQSAREALELAVAGKQRDIWDTSDMGTIDTDDKLKYSLDIDGTTYTVEIQEGEDDVVSTPNATAADSLSAVLSDANRITIMAEAINEDPSMNQKVIAYNINDTLVIQSKEAGEEFTGKLEFYDDSAGSYSTKTINSKYSINSGGAAEFLEIKTTIDQTASKGSLQLRLDSLGISDSAFGEFSVDTTGLITMKQDGAEFAIGQVAIALFNNERGLEPMGDNLLKKTNDSGEPIFNINNNKTAKVEGRTLELSTADLSESLVNLMVFQRAFEANAKSITTSDELLNTLINLKR